MKNRMEGKAAFVTGAARGQGRRHAVRLAEEGADIIALDIAGPVPAQGSPPATPEDLAETVRLVEALDRRIIAGQADVRDSKAVEALVAEGVAQLGRLDVVAANAGILGNPGPAAATSDDDWQSVIDTNLSGAFHTVKAAIPHIIAGGRGGAIVITSSSIALRAAPNLAPYGAAKAGLIGLMRTLSLSSSPSIRSGSIRSTRPPWPRRCCSTRSTTASSVPTWRTRRWRTSNRCTARATCCPCPTSSPMTSPTHSFSWHPMRPATSPAWRFRSMPVTPSNSQIRTMSGTTAARPAKATFPNEP